MEIFRFVNWFSLPPPIGIPRLGTFSMKESRVLFVCMGNICRSPAAEGILKKLLQASGLEDRVAVDSAGTISYHAGQPADPRMREAAQKRGYDLESRARQFQPEDFEKFDWIFTMDDQNFREIESQRPSVETRARLMRFCELCREHTDGEVPDPYYGGDAGFERVLDLLEAGCREWLRRFQESAQS